MNNINFLSATISTPVLRGATPVTANYQVNGKVKLKSQKQTKTQWLAKIASQLRLAGSLICHTRLETSIKTNKSILRPSSDAELNSNLDRPKLAKVRLLIQTSNLIRRT